MKMPFRLKILFIGMILSAFFNLTSLPFNFFGSNEYQVFSPIIKFIVGFISLISTTTCAVMIYKRSQKAIYVYAVYGVISFSYQMIYISFADLDKIFSTAKNMALTAELIEVFQTYFGVFALGLEFISTTSILLVFCSRRSMDYFQSPKAKNNALNA